jgi:2',3'-cyclic-nucleotide 2'-phosphodiesterase (5'-nucleotidase family)
MEVRVLNGQSLFDIAIQAAGNVEAVFDIALANGLGITDDLPAGTLLVIPAVANRQVADYYRTNNILPATGISVTDAAALQEGIEFWFVEYDFVVS